MSSYIYQRSMQTPICRQVVSAPQKTTARTLPSVLPKPRTRMPPHASTLPSRTNSRPSRFQKPGSTSSASDTTRTTVASTSDCEPSSSLRSLSSSQQSAAAGLYAPPQSLAPITNGASRFQKAGSISSASDSTTNTIASSTNTDSAFSVSLRSLNRTQQSATTGFYAPPPSLASITASTSRFSRFQKSAVKPSAAETTITTTIASSTGSEFAGSQFNGESLNTGSYASSSLVSEDAHFDDIHSAACAIAQDWTVNSSLSIVEKEIEPTIAAEIPEEVYLPPRFSDDYFAELEEKKMAAEGYLYGRQQRSAIGLAWILASRGPSKMFTPENQDIFRRCMITTIMKITKLDDDVVKGRVANMYLDYVETAYDLTRPLPEDADSDTSFQDENVAPFRNPSLEDGERLITAMSLGVENAFPVFKKFLMKRQEAFLANATHNALSRAASTRRKLRARFLWEEEQKRQQMLAEERRVQAQRQLSSAVTTKPGRKSKPQRTIECEIAPDDKYPPCDLEDLVTPELMAEKEEEDSYIVRFINKLGACFGEEGMGRKELLSWQWRKTIAQVRHQERRIMADEEGEEEEEEERKVREQRKRLLSPIHEETEDSSSVYEEADNSTITSTICDTIYKVTHTMVASILRHMGYP